MPRLNVHHVAALVALLACPVVAGDADKTFTMQVAPELSESGLLKHMLPRFTLKTGVRITQIEGDADLSIGSSGRAVFEGLGSVWKISVGDDPDALRFVDWLRSDVGKNTLESFAIDGVTPFTADVAEKVVVAEVSFDGDAVRGETLSLSLCGRCHVINASNRMNAIGSTPSFAVLKALKDWQTRFEAFYVLAPHGAFTQVEDITPPFDPTRPSPIIPVEMTLDDLEAILAFVNAMPAADLGKPIVSR